MIKKIETIDLGNFQVVSGILRISDPGYGKDAKYAGTVDNVVTGTWKSQVVKKTVDSWGHRCRKLVAVHDSFDKNQCTYAKLNFDVGVDSGQAGIFDDQFFGKNYSHDYVQTGECEYQQHNDYYHAKENISLYKLLIDAEAHLSKSLPSEKKDYYKNKLQKAEDLLSRGPGVFDYSDATKTRDWYEICCDRTLSNIRAGVIDHGVVSSSGFGDGSYDAYAAYNQDGKVVGIKILF